MRKIEEVRSSGDIGSSLAATVTLTTDGHDHDILASLGDDLRFVLIVSEATLQKQAGGLHIDVQASKNPKCDRCWHHRADVGSHDDHPTLCGRCADNLFGTGEHRTHA